jgi:late competence protein required for DNA uptake (superfamily II DNA/RNA helicase)
MRPNEKRTPAQREAYNSLWALLAETPVFKSILRIEAEAACLKMALESDSKACVHLGTMAEIIEQDSGNLTDLITDWLLDRGVTVEKLQTV